MAFFDALATVEQEREGEMPTHLRDSSRDSEGFGHGEGYLYPHAYRDHWVAQQYLPSSLQGKAFYQPSDQGYERQIRERVRRRREEQLAAMVEGTALALPEILTFSPTDRSRDRWLQRTISRAGEQLGALRDRVLDAAHLERHHVVLDVHARTGLLTWEVLRRTPEGGLWVLAADEQVADALQQQASQLDELQRPTILVGDVPSLPDLLAARGEDDLRFDAVLGRNVLTQLSEEERLAWTRTLVRLLRPEGRICLAQTVPQHTQRIYRLVNLDALPGDLGERVVAAEEAIYGADDPWVNWDAPDLEAALRAAGVDEVTVEVETASSEMLITPALLERWFDREAQRDRRTYVQHLLQSLSEEDVAQVQGLVERTLRNQTVSWQTTTAYITGIS
jgi:putative ATPase